MLEVVDRQSGQQEDHSDGRHRHGEDDGDHGHVGKAVGRGQAVLLVVVLLPLAAVEHVGDNRVGADHVLAHQEVLPAHLEPAEAKIEGVVEKPDVQDQLVVTEVLKIWSSQVC